MWFTYISEQGFIYIILTDSGSGGDSDAPNICEETKPPKDLTNIVISEYE